MPKATRLTEAERAELRERDRQRLEEAIAELQTSDGWRAWLRARATLHGYSLNNTLLIARQANQRGFEPTYVAGFKTWLKLGRCVRRGEKGLRILAPIIVKDRDRNDHGDHQQDDQRRRVYFRPAHVFDVSQTDPLPDRDPAPLQPPRAPLVGDSHAHLLPRLEGLAREIDYAVTYEPLDPEGLCDRKRRRLHIRQELAPNAQVVALMHELAHALIEPALNLAQALEEVVVEAVAYIASAAVGLDTSADSVGYIASWGDEDAADQVAQASELIDQLARSIEHALDASG
jgi:antirestriction protein ArdC